MSDRDELARELFIADNFNQPREQSIVDWQWFMETPRFTVRIDLGTPYMVDEKYVAGANWVRNQIEDVLKPTIERHEGHHTFHRPATEPAEVTS